MATVKDGKLSITLAPASVTVLTLDRQALKLAPFVAFEKHSE